VSHSIVRVTEIEASSNKRKPSEFARYRRALIIPYAIIATLGFAWLTVSVLVDTFRPPSRMPVADPPVPAEVCLVRVRTLLEELQETTLNLLNLPYKERKTHISTDWETFQTQWHLDWLEVQARCGFDRSTTSVAGHQVTNVAINRMAEVHRELPVMKEKYQSLIAHFEELQAAELARMQNALDQTETALRKREHGANP
jgi:hypothetical protein